MNMIRRFYRNLPIYKPQLTSTFPISHRISGASLTTIVLCCLICFTKKQILMPVAITALALFYHLYNGLCHLLTLPDFWGFILQEGDGSTLGDFCLSMMTDSSADLSMMTESSAEQEPHAPPAESAEQEPHAPPAESAPSALEERAEEVLLKNVEKKKGALGNGEKVAEVRQAVEHDFDVQTKGDEFQLIKQLEKEMEAEKMGPVTKSTFNEIKDYQSKVNL